MWSIQNGKICHSRLKNICCVKKHQTKKRGEEMHIIRSTHHEVVKISYSEQPYGNVIFLIHSLWYDVENTVHVLYGYISLSSGRSPCSFSSSSSWSGRMSRRLTDSTRSSSWQVDAALMKLSSWMHLHSCIQLWSHASHKRSSTQVSQRCFPTGRLSRLTVAGLL